MSTRVVTVTVTVEVRIDEDRRQSVPLVEDALQRALVLGLLTGNPAAGDKKEFFANDGYGAMPAKVCIASVTNSIED